MERLLQRVEEIGLATGNKGRDQEQGKDKKKVDKFTRTKREINLLIRELRNDIQERDRYANARGTKDDKPEIIRQSTLIRTKLQEVKERAQELRQMAIKSETSGKKGKLTVENMFKVCELVDAHIEECERWFKGLSFVSKRNDPAKADLLRGAGDAGADPQLVAFVPQDATQTELEDIEGFGEWQQQIEENEQEIDQQLDEVMAGTYDLLQLSKQMGEEYQVLMAMTDDVEKQMDKTQGNLEDATSRAKKLNEVIGKKGNCCLDVVLIIIMICCVGFILWKYVF